MHRLNARIRLQGTIAVLGWEGMVMGRAAKSYRMVRNNIFFKQVSQVAGISTPTLETNVRKLLEALHG